MILRFEAILMPIFFCWYVDYQFDYVLEKNISDGVVEFHESFKKVWARWDVIFSGLSAKI